MGKRIFVFTVCALAVVGVAAFAAGGKESAAKGPITVGSKIDTEGGLLGQMIVQMLRANGFTVVDKTQFGNDDGMICWVKKPDGSFSHDFKVFDRYLLPTIFAAQDRQAVTAKHLACLPDADD